MHGKPTYAELEQRVTALETLNVQRNEDVAALENLFELSIDMLCIADMNARFRRVNRAFERRLGYTRQELTRESFLNFVHPDDRESTLSEVEKLSHGEPTISFENRYCCKDGSYIWLSWTSMPDPEQGLMYAVARDITHRKRNDEELHRARAELEERVAGRTLELQKEISDRRQAREALKEYVERYNALFERSLDCVFLCDFEGNFMDANRAALNLIGYEREEMPSLNFASLLSEDQIPLAFQNLEEIIQTGTQKQPVQYRLIRKHGGYVDVESVASLIYMDGKPYAIQGCARDITRRNQVEEELRVSEERYRTILDEIDEGYFEVDLTGKFTFVNDWFLKIAGDSREDLMKMGPRNYMTPESGKKMYSIFNGLLKTEQPVKNVDYEIIATNGDRGFHALSASLMRDKGGNPVGFRGTVRDITQQKTAEQEKNKLEARLQQAEKMEAIGMLAGGVAHDLNNVLSGLVSYPELLLMDLPQESPLRDPILTIQKSGEKAATIVQDLLTLARRGVAVREVVNLNDIISEYMKSPEFQKLRFYHPGVLVDAHLEGDLFNILGSPFHLSKVVMNLVSNAAEAMPGGGKLIISTENRNMDGQVRGHDDLEEGDYVIVRVSDTGVGISKEDMGRIYEPFYTKKVMGRSYKGLFRL